MPRQTRLARADAYIYDHHDADRFCQVVPRGPHHERTGGDRQACRRHSRGINRVSCRPGHLHASTARIAHHGAWSHFFPFAKLFTSESHREPADAMCDIGASTVLLLRRRPMPSKRWNEEGRGGVGQVLSRPRLQCFRGRRVLQRPLQGRRRVHRAWRLPLLSLLPRPPLQLLLLLLATCFPQGYPQSRRATRSRRLIAKSNGKPRTEHSHAF